MKVWSVAQLNKERALKISEQFDIHMICAALLDVRGINTPEAVEEFLSDELKFDNPFEIKDMDKAASRVTKAIENGERICIYGDYDADGVTATTILFQYLETVGANVSFYIPSRAEEGYGLNEEAVRQLAADGVELLIGDILVFEKDLTAGGLLQQIQAAKECGLTTAGGADDRHDLTLTDGGGDTLEYL